MSCRRRRSTRHQSAILRCREVMGYTMVCSACAVVQDRVCSSERRELGVGDDDAGQRQGLEEGVARFGILL